MISTLPTSLVEAAVKHIFYQTFKYVPFKHFNCDADIVKIVESIDQISESLDSTMELYDVTDEAKKQEPDSFRDTHGISDFKVEFSPHTNEVITTYKRDGAWEIHHQRNGLSGERDKENKSPAMKFVSHMHRFVNDKISKGDSVRISAPPDLIASYHKLAKHFIGKMNNAAMTDIQKATDIHRLGVPVHEFLIHPTIHETYTPWFLIHTPSRMKFSKDTFGMSEPVKEYDAALRKQGHQID